MTRGQEATPSRRLTVHEARGFLKRHFGRSVGTEVLPVAQAFGRILAGDFIASSDLPRFNASAMDGFAVRSSDLQSGRQGRLKVVGRSLAGHPASLELGRFEAMRILTGAVLPAGADRVLKQEDCTESEGWITAMLPASGKSNVRLKGEDVALGSVAVRNGTRLSSGHLALLGSLGTDAINVHRSVRVALFSTGDEVCPGPVFGEGLVGDANRPMLGALLREFGCTVSDGGIVADSVEELTELLRAAALDNDLIITTGGMSVGDEDHLVDVIKRRGYLEFWRLHARPGKPVGFGDIDDCPVLGLPGNPSAALVMFLMLGLPLIALLGGEHAEYPKFLRLPAASSLSKPADWWEAIAGKLLSVSGKPTCVEALKKRGSAMLSTLAEADGFIVLPEDTMSVAAGDIVDFLPLTGQRQY